MRGWKVIALAGAPTNVHLALLVIVVLSPGVGLPQDDYQKWLRDEKRSFDSYISAQDLEFSSWLEEQWRQFDATQGLVRDISPKPSVIPVAPLPDGAPRPPVDHSPRVPPPPKPHPLGDSIVPPPPPAPPAPQAGVAVSARTVAFFGQQLPMALYETANVRPCVAVNEQAVSGFWESMSLLPQDAVVAQAGHYRDSLTLNDWGYTLLLRGIGETLFPGDRNRITLTVWYLLLKSGYDARIGYWDNDVFLLLPAAQTLYGTVFFGINSRRYFLITFDPAEGPPEKMWIFEGDYPGGDLLLDMRLTTMPTIGSEIYERNVSFVFDDRELAFDICYDNRAVQFLATFPLTDLSVYLSAPISADARQAILAVFQPAIAELSERRAVDLLLRFVQTGFAYKTDGDQFGREKYMFAEEVLSLPYSDCEDRSILFRYLVENLIDLDVVGLAYPGHVATAVCFREADVDGDAIFLDGRRFVVCDPTYVNAEAGMCMPQFRDVKPEIITSD